MKESSHYNKKRFNTKFSSFRSQKQDQHIIVMRHGDRLDCAEPLWGLTAERPWDPPLSDVGKARAFSIGKQFKDNLSVPIHRVIVSPFLRCVQTASQIVSALSTVDDNPNSMHMDNEVKVTIEYGLCEVYNRRNLPRAPKKGKGVGFNVSELEAMFPDGTVERMEPIYKKLPHWKERTESAKLRYARVIRSLAKRFPLENLLIVSHKMGVKEAVSSFMKDKYVYETLMEPKKILKQRASGRNANHTCRASETLGLCDVEVHQWRTNVFEVQSPESKNLKWSIGAILMNDEYVLVAAWK
ncbi:hypothetical protein IFM89_034370 [Coptis chinensis]|uniref:Uncharacterized protein n=1 Tax=Coptis chinensis TaxID=261450 RepID=A0A835HAF2_9MAGN|nr:hypothetical protein IFM89_034370 [Coptis chinensis]